VKRSRACATPLGVARARGAAILLTLAFLACLFGCAKKSFSKKELRAVTGEIVSAAQKATSRKTEITIRPDLQSGSSNLLAPTSHLAADDIFVTFTDASQMPAFEQSLDAIAQRHKLSVSAAVAGGVARFDLAFDGSRTHTIHVVTPLAARARPSTEQGSGPRLAIILDDLGYDRAAADALLALPFPLTVSVLPHLPLSAEVAEEAYRRGDQVLLHMPMESEADGAKPEEIELRVGMNAQQVEGALTGMLETVPHAVGVNNHQGSRATSDPALMAELMPALRQRGLFFIDSRTAASTVAYDTAERSGVRAASRKVFLDDTAARDAILAQLELAARDAARDGAAIAIGHPHPATIAALTEGVPRLEARGIRFVFVSDVVR
jgi:polysaccharide deacetylase 2 family uncharacterized protein YibQ